LEKKTQFNLTNGCKNYCPWNTTTDVEKPRTLPNALITTGIKCTHYNKLGNYE